MSDDYQPDEADHEPRPGKGGGKSRLSTYVRLTISLLLLIILISVIDTSEFVESVSQASPKFLALAIFLVIVDRLIVVHKWNLLLVSRGVNVPFTRLFTIYTVAQLSSFVLPSTVGGDLFRLYSLKKYDVSSRLVLASIMVERVIGFLSMLAIAVIALSASARLLGGRWNQLVGVAWTLGIAVLMCISFFFLLKHKALNQRIEGFINVSKRSKLIVKLHDVYVLCREYRRDTALLVKVTAYTFLRQIVPIVINVILAVAISVDASLLEIFIIVPLIMLGSRLPISMDGIGVQEGLYVVLFGIVGVSPSQALLMSVLFRLVVLVTLIPFGLMYVLRGRSVESRDLAR